MGSSTDSGSVTELNVGRRRLESFLRRKRRFVNLLLVSLMAGGGAWAIGAVGPASAKAAIDLDQCANLGIVCDTTHPAQWQHGNLNENNSRYLEGDSVPYRAHLSDLTIGATYSVTIEWDTTQSGKHAIDYLTSFDRSVPTADPCAPDACGAPAELAIPVDPNVASAGVTEVSDRVFTAYGATFPASGSTVTNSGDLCADATCNITANPTAHTLSGSYTGNSQTSITLYLTATSETVHLAWGGHIAERRDWGAGKSAVSLPGSPYHMRIISLECSNATNCDAGNQDRSLSSAAVVYGASITIVKEASIEGDTSYGFTASPSPLISFSLVDDGTAANTRTFGGIVDFTTYSISELTGANYSLSSVDCSTIDPNGGSHDTTSNGVSIDIREGEQVTCTFRNSVEGPKSIDLSKTADPTTFDEVADVITYTYVITNNGDVPLGPTQFTVADDHINGGAPFSCGPANVTLAVGASVSCTATYSVTTADIDNRLVTNKATASGAGVTSPLRTTTVTAVVPPPTTTTSTTVPGNKSIDLSKTAAPTTYDALADVITYTYVVTNDGDVPLGPTQFTITDDHINGGAAFSCGPENTTLAVGASVSCTAGYSILTADIDAKSVTNKATASGGGATSPLRTATVTAVIPPPSSTTTTAPATTTTAAPTTTTTIPATTTTFSANVVTTTLPATTTTSAPTTTVAATTTTSPPEFQALLTPGTTVPAESDFLVLFPDELPNTGPRFNIGFLVAALALLAIGALIGFLNIRSTGSTRKERNN